MSSVYVHVQITSEDTAAAWSGVIAARLRQTADLIERGCPVSVTDDWPNLEAVAAHTPLAPTGYGLMPGSAAWTAHRRGQWPPPGEGGRPDLGPPPFKLDGCTCPEPIGATGAHRAGCPWSDGRPRFDAFHNHRQTCSVCGQHGYALPGGGVVVDPPDTEPDCAHEWHPLTDEFTEEEAAAHRYPPTEASPRLDDGPLA